MNQNNDALSSPKMHPLSALFAPRSIAIVGASASPAKLGSVMLRSLASFVGDLYPIHPREPVIAGYTAYRRVVDVPGHVDLAILAVSASAVLTVLQDCAIAGVRAAIICSGGFAETGEAGRILQEKISALLHETGIRLLGPNTSGFFNPVDGVRASFVPGIDTIVPGSLAIVAQSGGVNHALAFLAQADGVGLRLGVGLGNAIDVGFVEVLDYLATDPHTRAIALHIEGVANGRALIEAIQHTTERVPVIALKVGRADVSDFARSHTGALTGNWRLTRAALVQAGAVVVEDTVELIDAAKALSLLRLPPATNPGVAVITSQAGPGLLITDALRSSQINVPPLAQETQERLHDLLPPLTLQSNPVDTGRPDATFGPVLSTVNADPAIDAIIAYALREPDALDPVAAIKHAQAHMPSSEPGLPIIFATGGPGKTLDAVTIELQDMHVPVYTSPERGARAMRALIADAQAAARLRHTASAITPFSLVIPQKRPGPSPLDEDEAKTLLEAFGVHTPRRFPCATREEAHLALVELSGISGHPVAVKILAADVLHKSDVGGVHLRITSHEALEEALDAIDRIPSGRPVRYLVEEMVPAGLELIVGGTRDTSFGPTVLLGLGGIVAEALHDVSLRLAPLTPVDAAEMRDEVAGRALLDGYRCQAGVDRAELIQVLLAVSQILTTYPEIVELDINPLCSTPDGLYALDALLILQNQK